MSIVKTFESFWDVDGLRWNSVDIFVNSKEDAKTWEEKVSDKIFFQSATCGKVIKQTMVNS